MKNPYSSKEAEAIRKKWYALLRREDNNVKITGSLCDSTGHCAVGLLWLAAGGTFEQTGSEDNPYFIPVGLPHYAHATDPDGEGEAYTLTDHVLDPDNKLHADENDGDTVADDVWNINDQGTHRNPADWTFKRIADWAEEKFA